MPLTIDPATVSSVASEAVAVLEAALPLPPPVAPLLRDVLPQLLGWIVTEIEGGGDPKSRLLALTLASADAAADTAQVAKFGNDTSR